MKGQYVNELAEGARVDTMFALRSKEMRAARTGDAYLALGLADKTGQIPAVLFRPATQAQAVPVGSVVLVRGVVTSFRGVKRVAIDSLHPATQWDPSDLLAAGPRSRDELAAHLKRLVVGVHDPELRRVLTAVFGDAPFFDRFCTCPGSQSFHHAYLGGLLEHTVAVAALCVHLAEQYPQVDGDLLVTAALLHDIGKCDELQFETSVEYTDEGRLLGHVVLGVTRLREATAGRRVKISEQRLVHLEHAMLSHHGELEWGSPKRPSTLEALVLHHADNLDAKTAGFSALLGNATRADEAWTDASNLFRRPLWAPRAAQDDRPRPASEDAPYERMSA